MASIEIGGTLHNTEADHVAVLSDEVKDTKLNRKQEDINNEVHEDLRGNEGLKGRVAALEDQVAFEGDIQVTHTASEITGENGKITDAASVRGAIDVRTGYFVCGAGATDDEKTVIAPGFVLTNGGALKIKMANANTTDNVVTLNINSTGAKPLYYNGEAVSAVNTWDAGEVIEVYYDSSFDSGNGAYFANNVAGGSGSGDGVFDVSVKYPTSGVEGGNTYTLDDALTVLNANLSESKKKGGMSIKFIQSVDNKYVQYRLKSDNWSIDTNDWSFCGDDALVENPEWIYVLIDAEKRILAGIKSDGSVEWSIGIPTLVKTYIDNAINEIKNGAEGTDLDGLNKIITFLSELSTSDTLKNLLDTKVDKEEGKSLIDAEYASLKSFSDNPEFCEVKLDSEGKILWAIKSDGSVFFGAGVPQQVIDFGISSKSMLMGLIVGTDLVSVRSRKK